MTEDIEQFHFHTTELLMNDQDISEFSLKQNMLCSISIQLIDFMTASDNETDQMKNKIFKIFIFKSVEKIFSCVIKQIFKIFELESEYYSIMSTVKKMTQMKSFTYELLDLIMIDELTFDDMFEILNTIFLRQLNFKADKNFTDQLFLVFRDQKTINLMKECKNLRSEFSLSYNCHK